MSKELEERLWSLVKSLQGLSDMPRQCAELAAIVRDLKKRVLVLNQRTKSTGDLRSRVRKLGLENQRLARENRKLHAYIDKSFVE